MSYILATWLADALRAEGVHVVEVGGWKERGRGNLLHLKGIVAHHTAGGREGDHPSLETIIRGRPGLHGPLAQILLSRSGIAYLTAAGTANHAGRGMWPFKAAGIPRDTANSVTIGIEWENVGQTKYHVEPIQPAAYDAYVKICAAICKHAKLNPEIAISAHREYAPSRKSDPAGINMQSFRSDVRKQMDGTYVGVGPHGAAVPTA